MDRAFFGVQRGFADRLGDGGVGVDRRDELVERHLPADGECTLADEIGRARPNDVHTENLAVFLPGDNLHQALAAVENQRLAVGAHGELADLIVDALRAALLLRQADGRGLRLHIDAGGVRFLVVDGGDAHDVLRRDLAHGAGGVRQLRAAEDAVADGVDAGDARLHLVVYDDAAAVVFNLPGVEVQALRVRAAADGDEHLLGLEADGLAALIAADDLRADGGRLHALHGALEMELHAHLLHMCHADLCQVAVEHGEHVIHRLDNGDLRTEGRIGARELEPDHAAADDDHRLRQLLQRQRAGGVDAVGVLLQAGDGRLGVDGAGRDDDRVGGHLLGRAVRLLDGELLRGDEGRLAVDLLDLIELQEPRDAARQLLGDGVLVSDDLREVDVHALDLDADVLALLLNLGDELRRVQQALRGDAADVQARAAEILFFDHGDLRPELRGADRRHIPAGPAADDNDILHTAPRIRAESLRATVAGRADPCRTALPRRRPSRGGRTCSKGA